MPQRYRAIFESAVDFAIVATDPEGVVTDWNPGAERVMGWTSVEMRGHHVERFFTLEDRAAGRPGVEMSLALTEGRASDERWHLRKDGTRFFAVGEMTPLHDKAGGHLGFLKILTDRTAEREAQAALAESEVALHRAQDAGGVGLFSLDIPSDTLRVTPEFCRLFGLPERQFYLAAALEALLVRDGEGTPGSSVEGRRDGSVQLDVEYRIRRADTGEVRWIARKAEIERSVDGAPVRMAGVVRDVTERHVVEEQLRDANAHLAEREAFLSSVLAASTDCIKVLDLDGRITFMSEGGLRALEACEPSEVLGRFWPDLLEDGGAERARAAILAAREGRETHFQAEAPTLAGTPKWWDMSVSPIRDADGAVSRILSVSRDRTALHEAERQQEVVNQEIGHRLKNTMAMVQAIASQTLRAVPDRAPVEALTSRLLALATAHDVLIERAWVLAPLCAVAEGVLGTFDRSGRIHLDGPTVELSSKATLSLSLLLHELGTNALKYGALSVSEGHVEVRWAVEERDGESVLALSWREQGGPAVGLPERRGFGSRLLSMGLIGTGGAEVRYLSTGVEADFVAPLTHLLVS